jgi:hypothetical protein
MGFHSVAPLSAWYLNERTVEASRLLPGVHSVVRLAGKTVCCQLPEIASAVRRRGLTPEVCTLLHSASS